MHRILLLMATRTYRARAFMRAARRLGAEVVVGTERKQAVAKPGTTLTLNFRDPAHATAQIVEAARERPFDAIVGVDDDTVLIAAMAAAALDIPHNDVEAVRATRNKHLMRRVLAAAGVPSPWFTLVRLDEDVTVAARHLRYPCVVKPTFLSGSRGVIRTDDEAEFVRAVERVRAILAQPEVAAMGGEEASHVLVEEYIPGAEAALEGILTGGELQVLALFDKPDPLDGPYFEETIYVTPARLPPARQHALIEVTAAAARALGLREGPVHAEVRLNDQGTWVVEIAARSIGGLCSTVLEFSDGRSLEELILLHAVGAEIAGDEQQRQPAGVMMIPISQAGVLRAVRGLDEARAVPGITGVTISVPLGDRVVPLPEGDRYLGFIFARGASPDEVEAALRTAHHRLQFDIEG